VTAGSSGAFPAEPTPATTCDSSHKELSIIEEKDFIDYFLIVSDIVKFAKDRGIPVGPGRGSAAASLVCYLLRITEVDPLLYPTLLFERFIDITRADLPDIDLDFDDERRSEIYDYAVAKYGAQCVGNIGTFTKYKSKNSLDDVGRVYRIPKFKIDVVKDLLLERSSGDLRASATIEDTAKMFPQAAKVFEEFPELWKATELEGNMKGMGVHAAGLVIANGPLTDVCATYTRRVVAGQVRSVISADKYDAEHLNILKIDVLGLSTMGMIRLCLEMIGKPLGWLYEIPLTDPEVIRGFKENDVVGIFQYDGGRCVRSMLRSNRITSWRLPTSPPLPGPDHFTITLPQNMWTPNMVARQLVGFIRCSTPSAERLTTRLSTRSRFFVSYGRSVTSIGLRPRTLGRSSVARSASRSSIASGSASGKVLRPTA
jgi:DNA polymerase III alpha subunit